MDKIKNKKLIIAMSILMVVVVFAIAYAAFTRTLQINGTADVRDSKWKIYFSRISDSATTTGTADVTLPTIANNTIPTTLSNYTATVMSPGDGFTFEVDVTNDGDYDAKLSSVVINSTPTCTGTGANATTDATNVCSHLHYSITYKGGASLVPNTDVLASKATQTLVVSLQYDNITDSDLLPKQNVTVSGLGITLNYVQDGTAKVNEDGTTPYNPYTVGKQITVANETYHIISSYTSNDYVVALKDNPLTADEVTAAGGTTSATGSEPGTMVYGAASNYGTSAVKNVVNHWATSKFTNSIKINLKTVNNYGARLATKEDLRSIGWLSCSSTASYCSVETDTPSWIWSSNYSYWTMSQYKSYSSSVWRVLSYGRLDSADVDFVGAVRPVINVYKNMITQSS